MVKVYGNLNRCSTVFSSIFKKYSLVLNVENSMQKLNPVFILVNPQMAENIGAGEGNA